MSNKLLGKRKRKTEREIKILRTEYMKTVPTIKNGLNQAMKSIKKRYQ
jgi:hypothetical protein